MARFRADEADNYGGQGGAGFFRLANDGDVARVRFMYNSIDDVEGTSVHQVELNGKKRYVNCLREYNEPVDNCPFCRNHMPVMAKLFVPVYDVKEDRVKIWERGKKFFNKISGLCSRYDPLVSKEFEIERHGKAGDTNTDYQIYPMDKCKALTMDDLPELGDDFNTFVLDKSAEDMEYFLEEGQFPPEEREESPRRRGRDDDERPSRRNDRRRPAEDDDEDDEVPLETGSRQAGRRTPASGGRRRRGDEDAF